MITRRSGSSKHVQLMPLRWRTSLSLLFCVFLSASIIIPIPTAGAPIEVNTLKESDQKYSFEMGQILNRASDTVLIPGSHEVFAVSEFTVTKTTDTYDAVCDSDCSLREAVAAANETADDDTIYLPAGLYELTLDWWGAADDFGSLDITQGDHTTTILGAGRDVTIIDATKLRTVGVNHPDRVFSVSYHAGLELIGIAVTGGYTENNLSNHLDGGGIWNWNGYLTVTDCLIEGNVAGVNGGGIANTYGTASITNTIIRDNNTDPPEYTTTGYGGGIYNTGTMTITNSTIEFNASDFGAGIANENYLGDSPGTLDIENSVITNNTARRGGGMANMSQGTATVTDSLLTGNHATRGWDVGLNTSNRGGGILNWAADLTVIRSTITNNEARATHGIDPASGGGGGIANHLGDLTVIDSTLSGNEAICDQKLDGDPDLCGRGGGILNAGGYAFVLNSTISGNITALLNSDNLPYLGGGGGGGFAHMPQRSGTTFFCPVSVLDSVTITDNTGAHGGGVNTRWETRVGLLYYIEEWRVGTNANGHPILECLDLYVRNAIVSENAATFTAGTEDCWGNYTSDGYNLVGEGTGCPTNGTGDIAAADPFLGPLANNGGETETHELLLGSPAIDAGDDNNCLATDQRGINRPQGAACDIGAYELIPGLQANLGISKTDTNDPVTIRDNIIYYVTVNNSGPESAQNVIVTDNLPGSVSYVSATPNQGGCVHASGVVTCNLGDIPNAGQVSIQIIATTTASAIITNNATVRSDTSDPNSGNNNASENTTVLPVNIYLPIVTKR